MIVCARIARQPRVLLNRRFCSSIFFTRASSLLQQTPHQATHYSLTATDTSLVALSPTSFRMTSSDDQEEEQLARAIALSLQSNATSMTPSKPDPVAQHASQSTGISGMDRKQMEAERLARLASTKRQRATISPPRVASPKKRLRIDEDPVKLSSGARLNFITAHDSPLQTPKEGTSMTTPTPASAGNPTNADLSINAGVPTSGNSEHEKSANNIMYPRGVIKKTWAFGHERTGDDVKIEEVLEAPTLRLAVLSAFQWDTDWIRAKLKTPENGGDTKCLFVMHAKEETLRQQILEETRDLKFLKICFPPMDGQIHCMHSKLMLLFHEHKLRIAIPTANLRNFDWGETGEMENSVFMIDLPPWLDQHPHAPETLTYFGRELYYFMQKQGFPEFAMDYLLRFDFSATFDMAFIHSVGGWSLGQEAERTGTPGLSRAIRELDLCASTLQLDFAASSIGSLNDNQLQTLYDAARGEDVLKLFTASRLVKKRDFFQPIKANAPMADSGEIRSQIRIYFPTYQTVTSSKAGAAGTICLSRAWFESTTFPREVFRDYRSRRQGLLSHNKILYARSPNRSNTDSSSKKVAWMYLGSANMSESAWGKLSEEKGKKVCKVQCRNWECGVLLSVSKATLDKATLECRDDAEQEVTSVEGADSETESEDNDIRVNDRKKSDDKDKTTIVETISQEEAGASASEQDDPAGIGMHVFDQLLQSPFEYPGGAYGEREPWYFKEVTR